MRPLAPGPNKKSTARRGAALLLWLSCATATPALAAGPAAQDPILPPPVAEPPPAPQDPARELPRVAMVRVEGQRRYTAEQLIAALGQPIGAPLDPLAIDRGIKRLWDSFRVRAEVAYLDLPPEPPGGGRSMEILLRVVETPSDREPRFLGNEAVDTETLERWAQIEDRTELFLHQARRVRQRLLEGYAREGYHWVEVNIVERGAAEDQAAVSDVIFEIREGPKVRVREVIVRGNRSMPDQRRFLLFKEGLKSLAKLELSGPSLFNWFGSPFVEETLEADLLAMRGVYRDRGWLDAVVEVERLDFNKDRDRVTIQIAVDEGPRYRVGSLSIEALAPGAGPGQPELVPAQLLIGEQDLLERCHMKAGTWFERLTLMRDTAALRDAYGELGHMDHRSLEPPSFPRGWKWEFLEPALTFDPSTHTIDVVYRLVQGRPLTIREVLFSGTTHTRDRVLRREVSVFPGKQADLKEINRSLARIQGTGFFSDEASQVGHREPFYRFLPAGDEAGVVDLVFEVEEGRVIDFSISGGIDSNDGLFGIVTLSMRNFDLADTPRSMWSTFGEIYDKEAFHGAGQRFDIEVSPGTELSRFRIHFMEPDLFGLHLNPISLDVDLTKRVRIYDIYDEDRLTTGLTVGRKFTQALSIAAGFEYGTVEVDDLDPSGVPPLLTAQEAAGKTAIVGPTLGVTLRELDNFRTPRQGFDVRWRSQFNDEIFGSDYDYVENQLHYDHYRVLGRKQDGGAIVAHVGVDLGLLEPYDSTVDVPYTERFFLGGSNTLRGFDFRGVGPMDPASEQPLGGETTAYGTLELYYPLYSMLQPGSFERRETIRATVFFDWGVLDPDDFALDLSEMRASVGFGFGLSFPLPLTFNFGFPVLVEDEDQTQVFSFTLQLF